MLNPRLLAHGRAALRVPRQQRLCRNLSTKPPSQNGTDPPQRRVGWHGAVVVASGIGMTSFLYFRNSPFNRVDAEEPLQETDLNFEKPRRPAVSPEDNRELISSQHLQVKKSWENPGVYLWGSNSGKVAAPESDETFIKTPRRLPFFDGVLLRDIKLDRNFAAAIDEKGDLLQWGKAFSPNARAPVPTLRGKDLISCDISRDRIIALSSSGTVYSVPVSQDEQKNGPKPTSTSWIPFWPSSTSDISYRTHTPPGLGWNERVIDIASGLEHGLLLTSTGRVFSFASGSEDYPAKGQLGIPGLTWESRPAGPFDVPHEVSTLKGFRIKKIAAGDYHSLVSDDAGRCFAFGDNSAGQLGFEYKAERLQIDSPTLVSTQSLYSGSAQQARVTDVYAGGNTSFLSIDAAKPAASAREPSRVAADTWAFGYGLTGQLGTGRWVHTQNTPTKIPAFSGLSEYEEKTSRVVPIRLAYISAGATHAAAIMDNVASVNVNGQSRKLSENETNWGRDILFWGNNEFYQIGTGKRSNVSTPTYIQPLDQKAEAERAASVLGWGKDKTEKQEHRFQITPRHKVKVGGRTVNLEQKVECGRGVTAVYSAV